MSYYLAYHPELEMKEMIKRSCAVATISVQKEGTQTSFPYKHELPASKFFSWNYFICYKFSVRNQSGMGMVMTLEISNMDKIYFIGTLMAWVATKITSDSVPRFTLIFPTYFNSNFVFFEKNHAR